jgi:hypothetical protein
MECPIEKVYSSLDCGKVVVAPPPGEQPTSVVRTVQPEANTFLNITIVSPASNDPQWVGRVRFDFCLNRVGLVPERESSGASFGSVEARAVEADRRQYFENG